MNGSKEEVAVKLHILRSLARSQRALARMVESYADMYSASASAGSEGGNGSGRSGESLLLKEFRAFAGYQRILAENIAGIRLKTSRRLRKGKPSPPWLADGIRAARQPGGGSRSST